jgi:hypothetical protein
MGQRAAGALRYKSGSVTVGVAADSTSNSSTEWVDLWATAAGAADTPLRVEIPHWNTGTGAYDAPTVVQAGGSGYIVRFSDTFTRTAADLYGSIPDLGSAWGGDSSTPGDYTINGTDAVATADAVRGNMLADPLISGDSRLVLSGVLSSVSGVARNYNYYLAYKDSSNQLFARISVSAAGSTTLSLWKRIAAVSTQLGSSVSAPLLANTAGQAYTVTFTLVGTTATVTVNAATPATGSITSGDATALGNLAGFILPTAGDTLSAFELSIAESTSRVLHVYNASVSGSILATQQAALATMFPVPLDLLIINSGHNYAANTPAQYEDAIDAFVAAFRAVQPTAGILISSQNPEKPPAAGWATHLARQATLPSYCARRGYGYLPALEAFWAQPFNGSAMVLPDGVHPTTGAGSGSVLWAATMTTYMAAV